MPQLSFPIWTSDFFWCITYPTQAPKINQQKTKPIYKKKSTNSTKTTQFKDPFWKLKGKRRLVFSCFCFLCGVLTFRVEICAFSRNGMIMNCGVMDFVANLWMVFREICVFWGMRQCAWSIFWGERRERGLDGVWRMMNLKPEEAEEFAPLIYGKGKTYEDFANSPCSFVLLFESHLYVLGASRGMRHGPWL